MRAPFLLLATIAVLLMAWPLVACGRKGSLDPPPGAVTERPQIEGQDAPATERRNTPSPMGDMLP